MPLFRLRRKRQREVAEPTENPEPRSKMNLNSKTTCYASAIVAGLWQAAALAQPTGQWDFNAGNLSATVGGTPMAYVDGPGGATAAGTVFGSTTSLGIPSINGTAANV